MREYKQDTEPSPVLMDNDVKNITKTLLNVAPKIVVIKNGIKDGNVFDYDFSNEIVEAAKLIATLRIDKIKFDSYFKQVTFDSISDISKIIAFVFDQKKNGAKQTTEFLNILLDKVISLGVPNQVTFLNDELKTKKGDLIDDAIQEYNQRQSDDKDRIVKIPELNNSSKTIDTQNGGIQSSENGSGKGNAETTNNQIERDSGETASIEREFTEGDKVKFTGNKGEELTGTIRSISDYSDINPNFGIVASVNVDQIALVGGVPIRRIETVPIKFLSFIGNTSQNNTSKDNTSIDNTPKDTTSQNKTSTKFTIEKSTHTKTGEDNWVVKIIERVDKEEWNKINEQMKKLGGKWWEGNNGWNFKTDVTNKIPGLNKTEPQVDNIKDVEVKQDNIEIKEKEGALNDNGLSERSGSGIQGVSENILSETVQGDGESGNIDGTHIPNTGERSGNSIVDDGKGFEHTPGTGSSNGYVSTPETRKGDTKQNTPILSNYVINTQEDLINVTNEKSRYKLNIEAVKIAKKLILENRLETV